MSVSSAPRATFRNVPLPTYPPGTVPLTPLQLAPQDSEETLFSYRIGAVFKPTPNISLYVAYGNAKTPTSATVRLGCGVVTAPGAADPCAAAPETARNYEIGAQGGSVRPPAPAHRRSVPQRAKQFPGAVERSGAARRAAGASTAGRGSTAWRSAPAARSRPRWTIFANYTYLDGEVLQSVSDFCLANPSAACLNSAAIPDPQRGRPADPDAAPFGQPVHHLSLPFGLEIGYGLTYQGGFATHQRNLAQRTQYFTRRLSHPPRFSRLCLRQRADRAAQRPELHRRALFHQRPQQRQCDDGRDHRRLGGAGRAAGRRC